MITCQAVPSSSTIAYSHKYTLCVIWAATLAQGKRVGVAFRARGVFTRSAGRFLLGVELPPRYLRPPTIDDVQAQTGRRSAFESLRDVSETCPVGRDP